MVGRTAGGEGLWAYRLLGCLVVTEALQPLEVSRVAQELGNLILCSLARIKLLTHQGV